MFRLAYPVMAPNIHVEMMAWNDAFRIVFPKLKEYGYEAVELLVRDPADVDKEQLDKTLEDNGLKIAMIGTGPMQREDHLFLLDSDREKREEAIKRLHELVKLGEYYQAPVVVAKYRGTVSDEPGCSMEDLAAILREADAEAGKAGIPLLIEPQNQSNINNLNGIAETVDWIRLNKLLHTKLLMDTYHMECTEFSVPESLAQYKGYLCRLHLADTDRLVPGLGAMDFKEILRVLKEIGFDGYASIEVKQIPDADSTAALTAKALRYLERLI